MRTRLFDETVWDPPPSRWPGMARLLIDWHEPLLRDMPWRNTSDPYHIWISEVMLHQTQVRTVIPYYRRFLEAFPSFQALSAAPLDQVLKLWEGLGYYARARNLHAAAQLIVEKHGGRIPGTRRELLDLPGIGPYTAGALLSIVHGQDEAVVDGNVIRVLCRVFDIQQDPSRSETRRTLWELARRMLPSGKASQFNQALMDLGSVVCKPRAPLCSNCPWLEYCRAEHLGLQGQRPVRTARGTGPHYDIAVGVIWKDGYVLIAKRPASGLLGGLWEFPGGKVENGETLEAALLREVREELDVEVGDVRPFMVVKHAYTHFRVTLHVMHCRYLAGEPQCRACADWRWEKIGVLQHYAFPIANRRIIAALQRDDVAQCATSSLNPSSVNSALLA